MNILIDGMDRCGKSTEVKLLRDMFVRGCTHVLKYAAINIKNNDENNKYMYNLNEEMFDILSTMKYSNFIVDRCHLSQYVYGKLYRNLSDEDANKLFKLEPKESNTFLIVIVDSNFKRLNEDEDGESISKGKKELLQKEYTLFKEAFDKSNIKNKIFIDLNMTSNREENFIECNKKILAFLSECLYSIK